MYDKTGSWNDTFVHIQPQHLSGQYWINDSANIFTCSMFIHHIHHTAPALSQQVCVQHIFKSNSCLREQVNLVRRDAAVWREWIEMLRTATAPMCATTTHGLLNDSIADDLLHNKSHTAVPLICNVLSFGCPVIQNATIENHDSTQRHAWSDWKRARGREEKKKCECAMIVFG